jgi:hypothetical protein
MDSGQLKARLTQTRLVSANDTAENMTRLVSLYANDLGDKINWPLQKFYDFVKGLPFKSDPPGHESIARPALTLQSSWPWRDCDDKSILIGSWLYSNKIPFKFQASSKAPSGLLHHVYVVARINGKPFVIDATYPRNRLGVMDRGTTKIQNLTGEIMNPTLNVFEGDSSPLLGFSMRKLGRGLKRNKWAIASTALGPAGVVGYQAWKHRKKLKKTLSGELYAINPELMGASFIKRMSRKAKKVGKVVLKTPGLKDSLVALVPGGPAMLAQARAMNKKILDAKAMIPQNNSMSLTAPVEAPAIETGMSTNKKILIGGGVAVGLLALVMVAKKR